MSRRKEIILLIVLIFILIAINYRFLDSALVKFLNEGQTAFVERIIDGDTIVVENDTHIRLLGINAPERGEKYYKEAKEFLEKEMLNKTVELEFVGPRQDKYYRTLAYIFLNGENINVKIVEEGFANYYFYDGEDKYSDDLKNAWDYCIEKNKNLCEKSKDICAECISNEEDAIINSCNFECDINGWEIKEEGRDKIIFEEVLQPGEQKEFELDLKDSGGGLFLRDKEGKLVFWDSY